MNFIREIVRNGQLYVLMLPGLLFLLIFAYLPLQGHLIAFKNYRLADGIWGSDWNGLQNFSFFFGTEDWKVVTFNTVYLNTLQIVWGTVVSVTIAVFINEVKQAMFKRIAQSFIFLPYFISWLAVSLMTLALLSANDGLVNQALESLGMDSVAWYATPEAWPAILTIIMVWKTAGYQSIIYLASIMGISGDYYESARIDGATRLQQIVHITLPLLRPAVTILTLLSIGRIFYGDFGMIYGIVGDNGMLYPTTDVIDTYSYRALRMLGDFGMASAVIMYQSVMGLAAILAFNAVARRYDPDNSLF